MSDQSTSCNHDHPPHEHELRSHEVIEAASAMASAMGDAKRLRLLELLFDGRHCVSELADETDDSMPAISQRLKILHQARLVARKRDGKHVYYSLADDHVRQIIDQLFLHSAE